MIIKDTRFITQYHKSAIIGFWRNGVDDATICAVMGCELKEVYRTIKDYNDKR